MFRDYFTHVYFFITVFFCCDKWPIYFSQIFTLSLKDCNIQGYLNN